MSAPLTLEDRRHGTDAGWQQGCRCTPCRTAHRDFQADWRSRTVLARNDPRHGTINGYTNFGCRCTKCRQTYRDQRPIAQSVLRTQLRGFFKRAGQRHPYVGVGPCLVCDQPPHDIDGTPFGGAS